MDALVTNTVPEATQTDRTDRTDVVGNGQFLATLFGNEHDITCPWVKEHTGEVNGGTAYSSQTTTGPLVVSSVCTVTAPSGVCAICCALWTSRSTPRA